MCFATSATSFLKVIEDKSVVVLPKVFAFLLAEVAEVAPFME